MIAIKTNFMWLFSFSLLPHHYNFLSLCAHYKCFIFYHSGPDFLPTVFIFCLSFYSFMCDETWCIVTTINLLCRKSLHVFIHQRKFSISLFFLFSRAPFLWLSLIFISHLILKLCHTHCKFVIARNHFLIKHFHHLENYIEHIVLISNEFRKYFV